MTRSDGQVSGRCKVSISVLVLAEDEIDAYLGSAAAGID